MGTAMPAGTPGVSATMPVMPVHGLPAERQIRQNTRLFWAGVLLILLIAAVVIVSLVLFVLLGDPMAARGGDGGAGGGWGWVVSL